MSHRDLYALPSRTIANREPLSFTYRNHRGEVAVRRVHPHAILFAANKWHPQPQYLMHAFDLDRGDDRWFAMKDIISFGAQQ